MKAVTRSEHERKELIICVLQHIRNLEDLGGIALRRMESISAHSTTS